MTAPKREVRVTRCQLQTTRSYELAVIRSLALSLGVTHSLKHSFGQWIFSTISFPVFPTPSSLDLPLLRRICCTVIPPCVPIPFTVSFAQEWLWFVMVDSCTCCMLFVAVLECGSSKYICRRFRMLVLVETELVRISILVDSPFK